MRSNVWDYKSNKLCFSFKEDWDGATGDHKMKERPRRQNKRVKGQPWVSQVAGKRKGRMTIDWRRKMVKERIRLLLNSLIWKLRTLHLLVEAPFVDCCCCARGSIIVVTATCSYVLVILTNAFVNYSSIYSIIEATIILCLVIISNNSFSNPLKSILNWCNMSSISAFLFMCQTNNISASSSKNSTESLNSFSHATFKASSCCNSCSLDKSTISINKLGPLLILW
jgi:hypothetical protein